MTSELTKAEPEKSSDKLGKFRDHLLHRKPLKPSEHETLEKYRKAFAWRCKLFPPQQVINMLMHEYNLRYSQAYQLMADIALDFTERSKTSTGKVPARYVIHGSVSDSTNRAGVYENSFLLPFFTCFFAANNCQ